MNFIKKVASILFAVFQKRETIEERFFGDVLEDYDDERILRMRIIFRERMISLLSITLVLLFAYSIYSEYAYRDYIDYLFNFSIEVQNDSPVGYFEPTVIPTDWENYDWENFVMLYSENLEELFLNIENSEEEVIEGWFVCARDSEEDDVCIPLQKLKLADFRLLDVEYYAQSSTDIQSRKQMKELLEKWR